MPSCECAFAQVDTPEEWEQVVAATDRKTTKTKNNLFWEIVGSIREVYAVLVEVHGIKSSSNDKDFIDFEE